jgi:hypothetical protein
MIEPVAKNMFETVASNIFETVARNMVETVAWNIVRLVARHMAETARNKMYRTDTSGGTGPLFLALPYSPPHRSIPIYMKCCAHRSV